jgi:GTP-binding protein
VVDGSAPDPWKDLETVRKEVGQFSAELAERPYLVALNKVDLEPARRLRAKTRRRGVVFVSALTGEGLPELKRAIFTLVASAPKPQMAVPAKVTKLPVRETRDLAVERKASGFVVRGDRVERLLERFDLDSEGGLARFQTELDRLGVNRALEAAGVQPGDSVRIADAEFEYEP